MLHTTAEGGTGVWQVAHFFCGFPQYEQNGEDALSKASWQNMQDFWKVLESFLPSLDDTLPPAGYSAILKLTTSASQHSEQPTPRKPAPPPTRRSYLTALTGTHGFRVWERSMLDYVIITHSNYAQHVCMGSASARKKLEFTCSG